jgi:uridine kinase
VPEREVIVIRGPSSVGKTTVGMKLAKRLNFVFIDEDVVRHKFQGDWLAPEAFEFSLKRLKQLTQNGKFVVVGYFDSYNLIQQLAPTKLFCLMASIDVLLKRNHNYPLNNRMPEERVRFLYENIRMFPNEVVISTDDKSEEEVVQELFSYGLLAQT